MIKGEMILDIPEMDENQCIEVLIPVLPKGIEYNNNENYISVYLLDTDDYVVLYYSHSDITGMYVVIWNDSGITLKESKQRISFSVW